jgi:hypothetical protein
MGTIVTQNVTQHAVEASNYRLLYISAGDVEKLPSVPLVLGTRAANLWGNARRFSE